MAYVQIPKDLSNVKTKVALNLTKRQLTGFAIAALLGLPLYIKTRGPLGNDAAAFLMLIVTLPVFFVVFYEKDGLPCEKYIKYVYLHESYQPRVRISKKVYRKKRREEIRSAGKSGHKKTKGKKTKAGRSPAQKRKADQKRKTKH